MVANRFEADILELIRAQFTAQGYGTEVSTQFEDLAPQRGRDIIVRASRTITLFGITFETPECGELVVYIECKSKNRDDSLCFEDFASNASQNVSAGCHAFILVTNVHRSVNALFDYCKTMSGKQKGAWLVDGARLCEIYQSLNQTCPFTVSTPSGDSVKGVRCERRLERLEPDYPQTAELTVAFCNMTAELRACRLLFQSTKSWELLDDAESLQYVFDLEPYAFHAHRFRLQRQVPDRTEDLSLALEVGDSQIRLSNTVQGLGRLVFHSEFQGNRHCEAKEGLVGVLRAIDIDAPAENGRLHILSATGDAGTGKSRLIEEVLRQPGRSTHAIRHVRHVFGGCGKNAVAKTIKALSDQAISVPPDTLTRGTHGLIEAFMTRLEQPGRLPILVLDDLHLADDDTCQTLIRALREPPVREGHAVLVLVGRSDYSHGGAAFAGLLSTLQTVGPEAPGAHVVLGDLEQTAFTALVQDMLPAAPPAVLAAIERLSGRVPQHVIQCVEWLLDMSAVRVKYRLPSGIVNATRFSERADSLPHSMTALLANRFALLAWEDGGEAAQTVIVAAALLGSDPSSRVFSLAGNGQNWAARRLVQERGFLVCEPDGSTRWQHESLLLHYRNWLLCEGETPKGQDTPPGFRTWGAWRTDGQHRAHEVARALLAVPDIFNDLMPLDQGLIAALAGEHAKALEYWAETLAAVETIDNWSTADLSGDSFPYLRWAYHSHFEVHGWSEMLPKLVRTETHIGGYYRALSDGIRAAETGMAALRASCPRGHSTLDAEELVLRVMVAHFRLDAGHVRFCLGEFLDLLARHEVLRDRHPSLETGYEIYNCLGMLFGYLNHRPLAEHYYRLAEQEADRLGNKTLRAKLVGDRSVLYQFSDHAQWLTLCAASTQANRDDGTQRHLHHAELGDLLVWLTRLGSITEPPDLIEGIRRILREIDAIETDCEAVAYFSVLPRIQLLRAATLYVEATGGLQRFHADPDLLDRADREADIGVGIAQRRGIGYAPWALLNLRAMIAWRQRRYTDALRHLETAKEILRADGMLFLGRADLSSPNQIVLANHIKILHHRETEDRVHALLRQISTYDHPDLVQEGRDISAIDSALRYHALLAAEELGGSLLLDRGTEPNLALVVWF